MRSRIPVLVLLCMAQFVDVLDVNASVVALPSIARDFGLSRERAAVGGHGVRARVRRVPAGLRAARRHLRPPARVRARHGRLHGGVAGVRARAGRRSAGGARAHSRAWAPRSTAPAALALLVDAFPGDRRAVAVWTGVAAVGGASGLVFGGVIADTLGWRWVFLINVPIGVVDARAHAAAADREPDRPARTRSARGGGGDRPASRCSSPRSPAGRWRSRAPRRWSRVFVRRERAAAEPLVIRDRTVAIAAAAGALLTATTSGTGVLASLYLQGDAGLGPSAAGLAMLPLSVSVVVGSIVGARMDVGIALVGAGCARAGARRRRECRRVGRARRVRTRRGVGGGDDARHVGRGGGRSRRGLRACSAPPRRSAPRSASPRSCRSGRRRVRRRGSPARSCSGRGGLPFPRDEVEGEAGAEHGQADQGHRRLQPQQEQRGDADHEPRRERDLALQPAFQREARARSRRSTETTTANATVSRPPCSSRPSPFGDRMNANGTRNAGSV